MGCKGLSQNPIVKAHRKTVPLASLKGKKLGVDTSASMYQFLYGLFDHNRNQFMYQVQKFVSAFYLYNILLVFILDGAPLPELKGDEVERRTVARKRKEAVKEEKGQLLLETKRQRKTVEHALEIVESRLEQYHTPPAAVRESNDDSVLVTIDLLPSLFVESEEEPGLIEQEIVQVRINIIPISQSEIKFEFAEEKEFDVDDNVMDREQLMELQQEMYQDLGEVYAEEMDCEEAYQKANNNATRPRKADYDKLKAMLDFAGIPYIQAPYETDFKAGNLVRRGLIDGLISPDSDTLMYGANQFRIPHLKQVTEEHTIDLVPIGTILRSAKLSLKQFREICFISGNDYTKGIYGLSVTKAYNLMIDPVAGGSIYSIAQFLIDKAKATIAKISKMRTRESEANQDKIKKANSDIEGIQNFIAYYDRIHDKIIDRSEDPLEWKTTTLPDENDMFEFIAKYQ